MKRLPCLLTTLLMSGCASLPPTVVTKTVFNVTEYTKHELDEIEEQRRSLGSPADLLDPFYTRLKYYLLVEADINKLYDRLAPHIEMATPAPKLKLMPVQGKIKKAVYQTRANEIINEFVLNRIEAYQFVNTSNSSSDRPVWVIQPEVTLENNKVYLKLRLMDENGNIKQTLGNKSTLTDYFFFNYIDGIRFD